MKAAWQALGEPEYPGREVLARLDEASRVVREPHPWAHDGDALRLEVDLPPHAVAAIPLPSPLASFRCLGTV